MKKGHLIRNYLNYRLKAVNEHGVHSPFVFELLNAVIYVMRDFYVFRDIEKIRNELLLSSQPVSCEDLGAGSLTKKTTVKTVKQLAAVSAKPRKFGQLLFRLVNHFQSYEILELGTSLGMSTMYLASANSKTTVTTMEGCPEVAAVAKKNFDRLGITHIQQIIGNFDAVLPEYLSSINKVDLVFFDGNHRKEPTLAYFRQCFERSHEGSIFIFDDIYWSKEMTEAWEEIKAHPQVTVTLDLFYMGLVFFRKEQVKQHFTIRF